MCLTWQNYSSRKIQIQYNKIQFYRSKFLIKIVRRSCFSVNKQCTNPRKTSSICDSLYSLMSLNYCIFICLRLYYVHNSSFVDKKQERYRSTFGSLNMIAVHQISMRQPFNTTQHTHCLIALFVVTSVLIGLNDKATERLYRWKDGSTLNGTGTNLFNYSFLYKNELEQITTSCNLEREAMPCT